MKSPRTLPTSVVSLLCLLLLVLGLPALSACGSRSADTTAAPTTLAPATTQNTMFPDAFPPTTTSAQQAANQAAAANILFRDDFQDGDTAGWTVDGAWVVQQDGDVYTFDTTATGYAYVPKGVSWPGDYAFKASYLIQAGTLAFSFDATKDGRYYVSVATDLISLVKEDAADVKTVLTQAQAPVVGQLHFITMAKKSGTIQVYVDKTLWLAATDAAPLTAGTIAVGSTDGTDAWVDDVLVNTIGKALPPGTPAMAAIDPSQVVEPPDGGGDLGELEDSHGEGDDSNDGNNSDDFPQPVVSFTGRPAEGGGEPSASLSLPPFADVVLEWSVENSQAVYIDGAARGPVEDMVVSNRENARYELEVIGLDGVSHSYYVDVTVIELVHGPDIVIQAQVSVQEGRKVRVHIQYWNVGDQAPDQCVIRWFPHGDDSPINKESSVSIPAGTDGAVDWTYTYDGFGTMHWLAVADVPEGSHPDANYSDNQATGSVTLIPGGG
jgi:hypothetical protein